MGIKTTGFIEAEQMLVRLDTVAKPRIFRELMVQGKKIQVLAIRMAPVDHGNLEKAIKVMPEAGTGPLRDDMGRFMRKEVEVYVDFDVALPEHPGKTVGNYAYEIHEHLFPMGGMNLGDKSNQKQIADPTVLGGGGFLTRAADQIEHGLDQALQHVLDELF